MEIQGAGKNVQICNTICSLLSLQHECLFCGMGLKKIRVVRMMFFFLVVNSCRSFCTFFTTLTVTLVVVAIAVGGGDGAVSCLHYGQRHTQIQVDQEKGRACF